jgi:hypothetical protein
MQTTVTARVIVREVVGLELDHYCRLGQNWLCLASKMFADSWKRYKMLG